MVPLLIVVSCEAPPAPAVAFDTPSRDVWAFEAWVEGTVEPGCAGVEVSGPRGSVPAGVSGERFEVRVPLAEGDNDLVASCTDGSSSEPLRLTVPLSDDPVARGRVVVTDEGLRLDAGASETAVTRAAPLEAWTWTERPGNPEPLVTVDGAPLSEHQGEQVVLAVPEAPGEYFVELVVTDAGGRTNASTLMFDVAWQTPLLPDLARDHADWVDEAVVYGVVPFFFGPGQGLADVRARLDHIEALGANTLWLSPIFDSPDDDFGYAVADPFRVRDAFGSEDDLHALIDAAHDRGMRVILDFVANHTSDRHPYYDQTPYADWYESDPPYYFGWENLPNLDYDNPEVQTYVLEAFEHWVRVFDVDGFRVDAAWGVRDRAPEFWARWRAELKRARPDLLLLAEGPGRDAWWYDNGYDAAYDWTWELGEWAWRDAFEHPADTVSLLRLALSERPEDAVLFRFLENNDTGERFVTRYGPEVTAVAATMLMTLDGLPMIYTGQEIGAEYVPYDEGPPLDWAADPHGLLPVYTELIDLRKRLPSLRSDETEPLELHPDVLSYLRGGETLVLLNFSASPLEVTVPSGVLGSGPRYDELADEGLPPGPVSLPAYGRRVVRGL